MRELHELFEALAWSKLRSRFRLGTKEAAYLNQKGMDKILQHARDFITDRLAPVLPQNDGRQTPMRGHPVFVAQHATATCCRSCLSKWHGIEKGMPLNAVEVEYMVSIIGQWLTLHGAAR